MAKPDEKTPPAKIDIASLKKMREATGGGLFNASGLGEQFGGSYEPLKIAEGTESPILRFEKEAKIPLTKTEVDPATKKVIEVTEMRTVPVFRNLENEKTVELFGGPLSAAFVKSFKEADAKVGDILIIARTKDATKKKGLGAGQKMQIYGVKILQRAEVSL